jgi:ACR3 family arsenite efflux pump ArsB
VSGRTQAERHQVWIYLVAIGAGLGLGAALPEVQPAFRGLLWPALAALLYATFTQVPLVRISAALRDRRFLGAMLAGNFLAVPMLVAVLLPLAPADPAVRLGIVLVLTVPCTDWFVAFTHLGGGDAARATAATPVLLVVQIALLPGHVWLLLGPGVTAALPALPVASAFALLILLPLGLAGATEVLARRRRGAARLVARLAAAPVPLLAAVVFLIAGAEVEAVRAALPVVADIAWLFALYLACAVAIGVVLARAAALAPRPARSLVFSLATRNSFVVLPLALALPAPWQAAAVAIVVQSLVELIGLMILLRLVARLVPER